MRVKVAENSPERLRLEMRNRALTYVGCGLVFILVGFAALWALGSIATVQANPTGLTYTRSFMGVVATDEFHAPPSEVVSIDIEERTGILGRSNEVVVHTKDRVFILKFVSADGYEKAELAEQATAALTGHGDVLSYDEGLLAPVAGVVMGGACIVGGIICVLAWQRGRVLADRAAGTITVTVDRHVPPKHTETTVPITPLTRVHAKASTFATGKHTATSYNVFVSNPDGSEIELAHWPVFREDSANETAATLREWLASGSRRPA